MSYGIACPHCGHTGHRRLSFTLWGGLIGPMLWPTGKCEKCQRQFNRSTGRPLPGLIVAFGYAGFAVSVIVGLALLTFAVLLMLAAAWVESTFGEFVEIPSPELSGAEWTVLGNAGLAIAGLIAVGAVCGLLAALVGSGRLVGGKSAFAYGFFFGPLGVLRVLLAPGKDASLHQRLSWLRLQVREYFVFDGCFRLIAIGSIGVSLLLLATLLGVPGSVFSIWAAIVGTAAFAVLVRYVLYPLFKPLSHEDMAVAVEREFPLLNDRLISALQFRKQKGSGSASQSLVQRVIGETEGLVMSLDLREVLKPSKLTMPGLVAVFSTVLLAGMSFAVTIQTDARSYGLELAFPDNDPSGTYNINLHERQEADSTLLIVASESDLLIRAIPRTYRSDETLDLSKMPKAYLETRSGDGVWFPRVMELTEVAGKPCFELSKTRLIDDGELRVRWDTFTTPAVKIDVQDPPTIADKAMTYQNPAHMRPSVVAWPAADATTTVFAPGLAGGAYTIETPRMREGRVVRDSLGRVQRDKIVLESEAVFAANYPRLYALHVGEQVRKSTDEINGSEGMLVTILLQTNRPLALEQSSLHVEVESQPVRVVPLRMVPAGANRGEVIVVDIEDIDNDGQTTRKIADPVAVGLAHRFFAPESESLPQPTYLASLRLEPAMVAYSFRLVDENGLRAQTAPFKIVARTDEPPIVRFDAIGLPLPRDQRSDDRYVTPKGYLPLRIYARDDFGLRSLELGYWVGSITGKPTKLTGFPPPRYSFTGYPGEVNIGAPPNRVEIPMHTLGNFEALAEEQVMLYFRVRAEDNKTDWHAVPPEDLDPFLIALKKALESGEVPDGFDLPPTVIEAIEAKDPTKLTPQLQERLRSLDEQGRIFRGQFNSPQVLSPRIKIVTPTYLQERIRFTLYELKTDVEALRDLQRALKVGSTLFRNNPRLLNDGIERHRLFGTETVSGRAAITGADAATMQKRIVTDLIRYAHQLDLISRHYAFNELETLVDGAPQENGVMAMKVMMLLLGVEKRRSVALSKRYEELLAKQKSDPGDTTGITRQAISLFNDLLQVEADEFYPVRNTFRHSAFAQSLIKTGVSRLAAASEAALALEMALTNIGPAQREAQLDNAIALQEMTLLALERILDYMEEWEGFEQIRLQMIKIRDLQNEVRQAILEAAGQGQVPEGMTLQQWQRFKRWDANSDNLLDETEWKARADTSEIFAEADKTPKDGFVTPAEWRAFWDAR